MCGMEDTRFIFRTACGKLTQDSLINELKEYNPHGIIAGLETYNAEVFDVCPNLKVISRVGSGIDNIDLQEAKKRGIIIFNTLHEPADAVAELAVAQMINLLRHTQKYPQLLPSFKNMPNKALLWKRRIGKNLKDCTVGIIGHGNIGRQVHNLLGAFGAKVIIHDINYRDLPYGGEYAPSHMNLVDLHILLHYSDIVTLHIPLNPPNNTNFFNRNLLKNMKKGSYLINTSRGGVVNEADLFEYLTNGHLAGAALDVFEDEPYFGNLRFLDNVICTPHIGSYTEETRKAMELKAFENIVHYLVNI